MSKHWNYLSRVLLIGVFALKGWEGFCAILVYLAMQHVRLIEVVLTEQDGRKKRTAKRLCVTNMTGLLLACFVVIFTYYCVLVLFKGE